MNTNTIEYMGWRFEIQVSRAEGQPERWRWRVVRHPRAGESPRDEPDLLQEGEAARDDLALYEGQAWVHKHISEIPT